MQLCEAYIHAFAEVPGDISSRAILLGLRRYRLQQDERGPETKTESLRLRGVFRVRGRLQFRPWHIDRHLTNIMEELWKTAYT